MTEKLQILLLGPPVVRWKGEMLSFQRRLPRALLFYLAWQGRMVLRETILDLFWGSNSKSSRSRLTETISRLRATLPDDDFLISHEGLIGLDMNRVYVDCQHFEELVDLAGHIPWQIPETEPLPLETYQILSQANQLWRGIFALPGVSFPTAALDHWLRQSTERLQGLRFNILVKLSAHAYAMLDFQGSLDLARIALEYEPYNEDVQLKIMQSLVKLGQFGEALQYFENTRQIMLEELDINPSPQMIQLYREIRRLDAPPLSDYEPKWELHPSMDVPFVGRRNALLKINQSLAQGKTMVILGESGQGKSRLVQEYVNLINPRPRLLLTVCRSTESTLPFHPFVELFRRHVTPDEWGALPQVWVNYLIGLLPELAQIRNNLNPVPFDEDSELAQAMIFESIRRVLLLMNERRPIFLVIDDAHWADKATLSTIAYLIARDPFARQASMVMIARIEDLTPSLQAMLDLIQKTKHASIFHLGHLQRENITHLAHFALRKTPSTQFIDRLMTDSGGNTFFVLEILRAIGEAEPDLDTSFPVTENLQTLILNRIQKITLKARDVLEIAALMGSEFSIQVLGKASLQTPEELAIHLQELEYNQLITVQDQHLGNIIYRFNHDKIRETLLNRISPARAQIFHGRIVEVLNKTPEQAAVLAHHYRGAGELKIAFQYWIKAAERARALFAKDDATRNYLLADEILQQIIIELSDDEIYRFYAEWNDLAYNITATNHLKHIGQALIKIGERRENHLLIGSGLDALSDACMTINDFELGLEYVNQAIEHLERTKNSFELIEAHNHRGTFQYMLNHLTDALASFQDALALSTELQDPKIHKARSNAHYQIALLQTLFGKPEIGYEHGQKAFQIAEQGSHTYSIAQAYAIRALAQFYLGEYEHAYNNAINGIELAERMQGWRMFGYLQDYAAMAELSLGHITSANNHANQAIQIGEQYGHLDIVALGCRTLGEIYRVLYDYPKAIHYYQKGYDGLKEHFLGFDNLYRLGLAQHHLGDSNAIDIVRSAHMVMEENAVRIGAISAKICLALIYASEQMWPEVAQLANELEKETLAGKLVGQHIISICLIGGAAIAQGDLENALEQYRFAAGEAQFIQNPWLEIKAQAGIEKVLQSQGVDASNPKQRIDILLNQFDSHISHPEIRQAYNLFYQQVSSRARIATDIL